MHLTSLSLEEFRQFKRLQIALPADGLGIYGGNATGKTTLLEAIAMLATTKSPRASSDREIIRFTSGIDFGVAPYARVSGEFERTDGVHLLQIGIEAPAEPGAPVRKIVTLEGQNRRASDAVGVFKCVLFEPADVDLATGSPALRRRYLDQMICQMDRNYLRALSRYLRIVEQRNSLLKALQKSSATNATPGVVQQLTYWDEELVLHGASIVARRYLVLRRLAEFARQRFRSFSPGHEIDVHLRSSIGEIPALTGRDTAPMAEVEAVVARDYTRRLQETLNDELRRGMTLTGPHRDDLVIRLDGLELAAYGSRGQQRLVVVAMKLAEADLIQAEAGEPPVLLLDDVLSELDLEHRHTLLTAIGSLKSQVLLTATDRADLEQSASHFPAFAELRGGNLVMETG